MGVLSEGAGSSNRKYYNLKKYEIPKDGEIVEKYGVHTSKKGSQGKWVADKEFGGMNGYLYEITTEKWTPQDKPEQTKIIMVFGDGPGTALNQIECGMNYATRGMLNSMWSIKDFSKKITLKAFKDEYPRIFLQQDGFEYTGGRKSIGWGIAEAKIPKIVGKDYIDVNIFFEKVVKAINDKLPGIPEGAGEVNSAPTNDAPLEDKTAMFPPSESPFPTEPQVVAADDLPF